MNVRRVLAATIATMIALGACAATPPPAPTTIPTTSAPTVAPSPTSPPSPLPTASPRVTPSPVVAASVLASIPYGVTPSGYVNAGSTVIGFGSMWVPYYASPRGWLVRIDMATDRVVARIAVGESPDSVAIAGGSVWVANTIGDASRHYAGQDTLSRIDPRTNKVVQTVPVEIGGPIAGGFGAVWVMNSQNGEGNGMLRKVDAATGRVVGAFPLPGLPVVACGALMTIEDVIGTNVPGVRVISDVDPRTGLRIAHWPAIDGAGGVPQDAIGRCFAVWNPDDDLQDSVVGVVSPDGGLGRLSPVVHGSIRILGGSFWRIDDVGAIVQAYGEGGDPTGRPIALPADLTDKESWTFLPAGGALWVLNSTGAFRIATPD